MYRRAWQSTQKYDSDCQDGGRTNSRLHSNIFSRYKMLTWGGVKTSARGRDGIRTLTSRRQAELLFPSCRITGGQQVDSKARASLSHWCVCLELKVRPTVYALGQSWHSSGSCFPYQARMLGLDGFYVPFSNYILKCYLNANLQTHTHTFYLLSRRQNRHPHPHLPGLLIACPPSQVYKFLFLTFKILPSSNCLIWSLTHLNLLALTVPKYSCHFATCRLFANAVSELPSFPHYYRDPAYLWGGRMVERIPDSSSYHLHVPCHQGGMLSGTRHRFCILRVPRCSEMWLCT